MATLTRHPDGYGRARLRVGGVTFDPPPGGRRPTNDARQREASPSRSRTTRGRLPRVRARAPTRGGRPAGMSNAADVGGVTPRVSFELYRDDVEGERFGRPAGLGPRRVSGRRCLGCPAVPPVGSTGPSVASCPRRDPSAGLPPSARLVSAEERAQDPVDLAQVAGRAVLHEERQQLLGVLARHRRAIRRRVRQRPERNLERSGNPVEAVDRDRFLAALDLADEFAAEPGVPAQGALTPPPLLAEGAEPLAEELPEPGRDPVAAHGRTVRASEVLVSALICTVPTASKRGATTRAS